MERFQNLRHYYKTSVCNRMGPNDLPKCEQGGADEDSNYLCH